MLNSYRKNMQACLQRNSDLLSESILHQQQLPTILDLYFRFFQAHGELINDIHFINLINICLKNPLTVFACWTKRKDIVNKVFKTMDKPKNLILIIFPNPIKSKIMQRIPKHFDKTFNNVLENENVDQQNCTGQKCKDCLACYKFDTTTTIVEKVKVLVMKKFIRIEKVKKFLEKKQKSKDKTLKRKNQRQNKKLGSFI